MSKGPRVAPGVLLALLAAFTPAFAKPQESPAFRLERTILLPRVSGRIDHMAVDLARKRLFVAELGNDTVDVIDLNKGVVAHRIEGLKEPQGIGYNPRMDLLAVANAGDGSVHLFRGSDFSPEGEIALGSDADNIRVNPSNGQMVIGFASGGLAVLNADGTGVLNRFNLPAHPEGFQIDATRNRFLINIPDARQIAVVNFDGKQVAAWHVPGLSENFPMALDQAGARIATVFRSPAHLTLLDSVSGNVAADVPTCDDADDVFFDTKRNRLYVSCGQGVVDVFESKVGEVKLRAQFKTSIGARTSLFVPELDRLFVASRGGFFGLGSGAAILVLQPGD